MRSLSDIACESSRRATLRLRARRLPHRLEVQRLARRACVRGSFVILAVALLTQACTTTSVEFDRMTGAQFPQDQVVDGETVTVSSIYVAGDKLVAVDEDDTAIPALTNADGTPQNCISNAELDSVMAGYRQTQVAPATFSCGLFNAYTCTRYHLYGVVANHFGRSGGSGACDSGLLGRMWRTDNRGAFAMFYKNATVQGNGAKYLRSAAHEIGHAFNLHHEDGDGSTTIMNQTGVVGDSFTYEFSDNSETHLEDHPDDCVFPGIGTFGSVNAEHAGWHGGTDDDCS